MKTLLCTVLLLGVPFAAHAAMSQAECPPDTIWNSSTNQCYPDPDSPTAKREQARQRAQEERVRQEQRYQQQRESAEREAERRRKTGSETVITNPSQPLFIER